MNPLQFRCVVRRSGIGNGRCASEAGWCKIKRTFPIARLGRFISITKDIFLFNINCRKRGNLCVKFSVVILYARYGKAFFSYTIEIVSKQACSIVSGYHSL